MHCETGRERFVSWEKAKPSWITWFLSCIESPDRLCWIDGNQGFLTAIQINPFWYNEMIVAQEVALWVMEHNKGVGKRLLDVLEQWAKEIGASIVASGSIAAYKPEKMEAYLERRGYALEETHYILEVDR